MTPLTITQQTKKKVLEILNNGIDYCEYMLEKHDTDCDVLFLVKSYDNKFSALMHRFRLKSEIDLEEFSDEISRFESGLFAWYDNLDHNMFGDDMTKNSLYSVLYAVLSAVDRVLEEDLLDQQDSDGYDAEEEEGEFIIETDTVEDDEDCIEPEHVERCFPD